jgi:hypothetical protein
MGKEINTSGDEMFPTMGLDGTLYFSSNGHSGMGGLDIFKATGKGAKWSPVENMKYPINSGGDDFYLIAVDSTNSRGYFSSNRMGGKGSDDIYAFIPVEKQEPVAPTPPPPIVEPVKPPVKITPKEDEPVEVKGVLLAGKVFDSKTKMPLPGAKICATHDNTKTSVCKEVRDDGNFTFTLRPNTRYTLSGFKEGYLSTEPLKLASSSIIEGQELPVEMQEKTKTSFRSTQQVVDRYTPKAAKPSVRRNQREYRIQVLALQNDADIDWEYFEKLRRTYPQFEVVYTQRAKTKRYTYGTFTNIAEARRYLQRYINLGYPDSFIAVFVNNRQVESIYSSGKRDRIR